MQKVTFPRPADNVVARADEHGLWIETNGWTVPIKIVTAQEYANSFNPNDDDGNKPNHGFYNVGTGIVLTHKDAKIHFGRSEALAVIDLIKAATASIW
jgi:hypothetical protein